MNGELWIVNIPSICAHISVKSSSSPSVFARIRVRKNSLNSYSRRLSDNEAVMKFLVTNYTNFHEIAFKQFVPIRVIRDKLFKEQTTCTQNDFLSSSPFWAWPSSVPQARAKPCRRKSINLAAPTSPKFPRSSVRRLWRCIMGRMGRRTQLNPLYGGLYAP